MYRSPGKIVAILIGVIAGSPIGWLVWYLYTTDNLMYLVMIPTALLIIGFVLGVTAVAAYHIGKQVHYAFWSLRFGKWVRALKALAGEQDE